MDKFYRVSEFAKRVGKSASTIRRWDREGRLIPKRSMGGHRFYNESDVRKALQIDVIQIEKRTMVYCRVSSRAQLPDLKLQVEAMRMFCLGGGIAVDEWIEEIGGGLNLKRKKFLNVMQMVENREVSRLIIAHKDRLARFGFDYIEHFCSQHDCKLIVANQEQLSPQQEMVEDLMAIVHCFSSRLYGLRSYKKQIKEAAEHGESNTDSI